MAEGEREEVGGIRIPTLSWPPDPHAAVDSLRLGEFILSVFFHDSSLQFY
jgi:hypothetical protein